MVKYIIFDLGNVFYSKIGRGNDRKMLNYRDSGFFDKHNRRIVLKGGSENV